MSSNKIIGVRNGATEIVDSVTEGFCFGTASSWWSRKTH